MKRLVLFVLFCLVVSLAGAQVTGPVINVTPVISTTTLDSIRVVSGSTTVYSRQERAATVIDTCYVLIGSATIKARGVVGNFSTIVPGGRLTATSAGIPAGAYVVSKTNDTTIVMSDVATATAVTTGDTISFYNPPTRFASVTAGMRVVGTGIPPGTTVASKTDSVTLILSAAPTSSSAVRTLNVGYYTSEAYATGDMLGVPFDIGTLDMGKNLTVLMSVLVIDAAKQAANMELVIFDSLFTASQDTAAFSPSDADAAHIIAVIPLTTWYNYGVNSVCSETSLGLEIKPQSLRTGKLYGALVSRGTPTYAASNDLKLRIAFYQQ